MKAIYELHILKFKFDAGTSRGVLREKKTWYIKVYNEKGDAFGIGECGPLVGLSIDDRDDFELHLKGVCNRISDVDFPVSYSDCLELAGKIVSEEFPSIRFGLETALLDLLNGYRKMIFQNDFFLKGKSIPINGLIWMGEKDFMLQQIDKKLEEGYSCLKMKIGAIDFNRECELLQYIRNKFSKDELVLRVDANGAFTPEEAKEKLTILKDFDLHSIEQPIKPKQVAALADIVRLNLVPIALDEELIGVSALSEKINLLDQVNPPFIILKPSLLGGIKATQEWIELAEERKIGWWITSALESNIGLNAIAQLTAEYNISIPQGLGTGQLYHNNIPAPLEINSGHLYYGTAEWGL